MSRNFIDATTHRRSYYHLQDRAVVDDNHVIETIDTLLTTMPSPFNVQSARIVLLLNEQHRDLWDIVVESLQTMVDAKQFERTKEKITKAFASGHGTLLFYEDEAALNHLRESFPLYANKVSIWSDQSSGMMQFALWTALEDMGYGASLQHYNPIIDDAVAERWLINPDWRLVAQIPFGVPLDTPAPRTATLPIHQRRLIFGKEE